MKHLRLLISFVVLLSALLFSCRSKRADSPFDRSVKEQEWFDLTEIQENGELIVLTEYGPDTYFEWRGEHFGRQYMLADAYARSIGTSMRVEVGRSIEELQKRMATGDGDIIIYNVPDSLQTEDNVYLKADTIISGWAVSKRCPELAENLQEWIEKNNSNLVALSTLEIRTSNGRRYTPRRRVSAPIRNLARGEISIFDPLFKQYGKNLGWDWKLLAAQAYQESAFDPEAVSFMGAMGLMQLMPSTAKSVGVKMDKVFVPEHNVRGAARLISLLKEHYSKIHNESERINFILAAYNAGSGHVDDARRLAKKYGKDPDRWLGNVDGFVLRMAQPRFYNQPEVQHGFFRGQETHDYVNSIRSRWDEYRRKVR